jgi:hypothetical protein
MRPFFYCNRFHSSFFVNQILPVALTQDDAEQRVQRRVIAAKLIEKLCAVLDIVESVCPLLFLNPIILIGCSVRRDIVACAQMLCQDPNANVRAAIAQRLPIVMRSLELV